MTSKHFTQKSSKPKADFDATQPAVSDDSETTSFDEDQPQGEFLSRVRRVGESEASLLTICQCIMMGGTGNQVAHLLQKTPYNKIQLSSTAIGILKRTLARGSIYQLMKLGGAAPSMTIRDGFNIVYGRTWQRHPVGAFSFSANTFHTLQWLYSASLHTPDKVAVLEPQGPLTDGDEWFLYLTSRFIFSAQSAFHRAWAKQPMLQNSWLSWFAYPQYIHTESKSAKPNVGVKAWFSGMRAIVLESLQGELGTHILNQESKKATLNTSATLLAFCEAQESLFQGFLRTANESNRRDLLTCMLIPSSQILTKNVAVTELLPKFVGALPSSERLSDRSEARKSAGSLMRAIVQLNRWSEEMKLVRHFDDDYDIAQGILRRWEPYGFDHLRLAEDVLRALESLDAGVSQ